MTALSSAADADQLAEALRPVIADPRDRAFVVRCILDEGPVHHRASSWALLMLASEIARRLEVPMKAPDGEPDDSITVRLRLPPHLAADEAESAFPLRLPLEPLRAIASSDRDVEVLADALVDGPPHHALANAALVSLLARVLAAVPSR